MPSSPETIADEARQEARLRRQLSAQGFALRKSRVRPENRNLNNQGAYMIVDAMRNIIVAGERFDLGLEEVKEFVAS